MFHTHMYVEKRQFSRMVNYCNVVFLSIQSYPGNDSSANLSNDYAKSKTLEGFTRSQKE